jgi:hypothetical protein
MDVTRIALLHLDKPGSTDALGDSRSGTDEQVPF